MERQFNILMVGGNARKSGKTTIICRLLERYGTELSISAVKAALYDDQEVFREHYPRAYGKGYLELKETDSLVRKDSGKYLRAGALESWFLAAVKKNEDRMIRRISEIANRGGLMIIESNALRNSIHPGIFIMVNNRSKEEKYSASSVSDYADLNMETGGEIFDNIEDYIDIKNNIWNLNKTL